MITKINHCIDECAKLFFCFLLEMNGRKTLAINNGKKSSKREMNFLWVFFITNDKLLSCEILKYWNHAADTTMNDKLWANVSKYDDVDWLFSPFSRSLSFPIATFIFLCSRMTNHRMSKSIRSIFRVTFQQIISPHICTESMIYLTPFDTLALRIFITVCKFFSSISINIDAWQFVKF